MISAAIKQIPLFGSTVRSGDAGVHLDNVLLGAVTALVLTGILLIYSASVDVAYSVYGNGFYHLLRHLLYLGISLTLAIVAFMVPISLWQRAGGMLLVCSFVLLCLVLMPGIGHEVNGSMRWIRLGPLNLQASELVKLFVVIYLAGYLVRRHEEVRSQWSGFLKPMSVMALMIVLLLLEPDFGAVVVMMTAVLGMMFLSGVMLSQFSLLILVSFGAVALMAVSQPYRMQRLVTFLEPWSAENVYGSGYQLTQALIAFGRGEWTGVGLGNSVQKLFYLPEAHTDFVFAILAEEMGLLGSLLVIALFALMVIRILMIGRRCEKVGRFFGAYLSYGVGLLLAAQVLINIGVNSGLLPTKGLTLPLLSYGGSSLMAVAIGLAIVFRVNHEYLVGEAAISQPSAPRTRAKSRNPARKRS